MLLYGIDSVFLKRAQIKRMSVAFNAVLRHIFLIGTKTLDCLYEERLMCLIRNCGCSNSELLRFCCLLCTARRVY